MPQGYPKPMTMFGDRLIKKLDPEGKQLLSVLYVKQLMTFACFVKSKPYSFCIVLL